MRLLHVEDNPADRDLARRALARAEPGWVVAEVGTLAEARQRLGGEAGWDLVLTDLRLPDGSGLELLAEVREQELPAAVVVITGSGDEESAVAALKAGADDYAVKAGAYLDTLPALLASALLRRRSRQERRRRPLRVLYAEHHAADVDLTRRHLARHAPYVHLEVVGSGAEALARLEGEPAAWDAVLLDYHLPGESGLAVLKELVSARRPDLPVVLVTGQGNEEVAVQALRLGAADYVVKNPGYLFCLPVTLENAYHRAELLRGDRALRDSEARYRTLFGASPLPLFAFDAETLRIVAANGAAGRCYGYAPEEFAALSAIDLRPPEEVPGFRAFLAALERGEPVVARPTRHRRKDGTFLEVEVTGSPLALGGRTVWLVAVNDVTAHRSLEEQLRQAQKMEAVGRLAGGVAHDFNNLLQVIIGTCELALADLAERGAHRKAFGIISEAADRAAGLTRQLLAFARKQVLEPKVLDLNQVVAGLEKMLPRLLGEDVRVVHRLAADLGRVKADPGQVEQVLVNLAVNARDAMPGGGTLTIETANVDLDEAYTREHPGASPGPHVLVAVTDTGTGIAPEVREHLFEPFFTTKEVGKGTGLGLATVYGIVKQSGGCIYVYSEPGQGAIFKVFLPRVDGAVDPWRGDAAAGPTPGGSETVLVAEDEAAVRGLLCQVLAAKGYAVLEAANGAEALGVAEGHPGPIHLVVADVVMPDLGGRELAERLRLGRPGLRVLYVSGYTDDAILRRGALEPGAAFLQKPFSPAALARKVREVLDQG